MICVTELCQSTSTGVMVLSIPEQLIKYYEEVIVTNSSKKCDAETFALVLGAVNEDNIQAKELILPSQNGSSLHLNDFSKYMDN